MSGYIFDGNVESHFLDPKKAEIPSIQHLIFSGGINASSIGAVNHGSTESNIAQRGSVFTTLDNIMNGGGDKITYQQFMGQDGEPIKLPYVDSDTGHLVYPNEKGVVRAINGGFLSQWKELNDQLEDRIDEVMEYCIISDELSQFVLGISKESWEKLTKAGQGEDIGMSEELAKLNCGISYIKSLPANSVSQTGALSKLRFIVRVHLRNVNIKGLISKDKIKATAKSGKPTPKVATLQESIMDSITESAVNNNSIASASNTLSTTEPAASAVPQKK